MTVFIRPEFTPGTLPTFNGYHLQIFASGRAKVSLQMLTNNKKKEFYTALPKRDRDGLRRQKARSLTDLPDHYAALDQLLSAHPDSKVFRLHAKGDNNATADNAHVIASLEQATLWLVMSGVVHQWGLTTMLVHVLLQGKGKRKGEASIFNEYAPTQDHDWQDATFEMVDYAKGLREGSASTALPTAPKAPLSKVAPPPSYMIPQPTQKAEPRVQPTPVETDYVSDDPCDDPILFAELLHDSEEETFPEQQENQPWKTTSKGQSTLYGTDGLRAQLLG
ncbi:hypothetical protein C7964_106154 [Loktanella sp. PT4BL]|jgi:hypothetical protein|uniref:hypothetical protein n=1 Tax=Loktanella sp. PT4BL TaxID=2135611 RepID=UPI000D770422|nr:hypothetical protein [Loktanella sp. PT4BL]PXW67578.1 hypothetical protein C7964_106154 [Loktanella sp. PT4BL]